jgi:F-type H+-transporting ATPase subunit b
MDYVMNVGNFFWLATEAAAGELAEEVGGFGLNFDIFEANLINLAVVIAVVVYFGKGFLSKALGDRRDNIATTIKEAEQRQRQAEANLAQEQKKLAEAQQEAARIRANAETSAVAAKAEIMAKAEQEIARIRDTAAQDTTASQERVLRELREQIAAQALQQVEQELQGRLSNEDQQRQLIDRSIALLGR